MKNKKIMGLMILSSLLLAGCGSSGDTSSISSGSSSSMSATSSQVEPSSSSSSSTSSSSSQIEPSSSSSISSSSSAEPEEYSRYEYSLLPDGTLAIAAGQNKYLEKLTIPQMHDGKAVTKIVGSGFSGCTSLKEIEIPNSITEIGEHAFSSCTSLKEIEIPNSVTTIADYAFQYCTSLTSVVIPNSVTTIGNYAFENCTSLTSIIIPSSVTTAGSYVFFECSSLKAIYCEAESQPEGWDTSSWSYRSNATIIWGYAGENGIYNDFTYAICIKDGNKYATLIRYSGNTKEIEIPDSINGISVAEIGYRLFFGYSSLTSIEIPSSVTTIGGSSFRNCTSLKSVIIPNSVTTIRGSAFAGCTSLKNITIPSSVTTIGNYAFQNCSSLTSVVIPSSVTTMGYSVFDSCSYLETIYCEAESQPEGWFSDWAPSSKAVIWGYVKRGTQNGFSYTICVSGGNKYVTITRYSGNTTEIEIPSSINEISVTTISNSAFKNRTSLKNIIIPNTVTTIGGQAFYGCKSLLEVEIPNSVTTIGEKAFSGCTSLTNVTIPNSVTSIGNYAFQNCTSLRSIVIPRSVTTMGSYVIYDCKSLKAIYCEAESQPEGWSSNWYSTWPLINFKIVWEYAGEHGTYNDFTYAICSNGENKYVTITGYNGNDTEIEIPSSINEINVTTIGEKAFYGCESLSGVEIPNSVTTIGDSSFRYCTSLTSIIIPKSVITIEDYAFENCTSLTIYCEAESQPEGWDSNWSSSSKIVWGYAGEYDTYNDFTYAICSNSEGKYITITGYNGDDTEIEIPSSINGINVTTFGKKAFYYRTSLKSIIIPSSVTTIGDYAFQFCTSLTSIIIPSSVTTMGHSVFDSCSYLETIYCEAESQPEGWDSSWSSSFKIAWGCIEQGTYNDFAYVICNDGENKYTTITGYNGDDTEIEIPSSINGINVTTIGNNAFYNCTSLKSIIIPSSVTTIGKQAFSNCTSLTDVIIPKSVIKMSGYVFYNCRSLETIYCEAERQPEGWDSYWDKYSTILGQRSFDIVWGYNE